MSGCVSSINANLYAKRRTRKHKQNFNYIERERQTFDFKIQIPNIIPQNFKNYFELTRVCEIV